MNRSDWICVQWERSELCWSDAWAAYQTVLNCPETIQHSTLLSFNLSKSKRVRLFSAVLARPYFELQRHMHVVRGGGGASERWEAVVAGNPTTASSYLQSKMLRLAKDSTA